MLLLWTITFLEVELSHIENSVIWDLEIPITFNSSITLLDECKTGIILVLIH